MILVISWLLVQPGTPAVADQDEIGVETLVEQSPMLAIFAAIGLGYALGRISVAGFSLDIGAVLFAGLAGFTTFAGGRPATEVIEMLNAYWGSVVPVVVEREGGLIERFAGDAVLAVFNALGDHPDHAARAVRAAVADRRRGRGRWGRHLRYAGTGDDRRPPRQGSSPTR